MALSFNPGKSRRSNEATSPQRNTAQAAEGPEMVGTHMPSLSKTTGSAASGKQHKAASFL
jgi:hypothetical protein